MPGSNTVRHMLLGRGKAFFGHQPRPWFWAGGGLGSIPSLVDQPQLHLPGCGSPVMQSGPFGAVSMEPWARGCRHCREKGCPKSPPGYQGATEGQPAGSGCLPFLPRRRQEGQEGGRGGNLSGTSGGEGHRGNPSGTQAGHRGPGMGARCREVGVCLCTPLCMLGVSGPQPYLTLPLPRTLPWKPSWATLECVFTAQWLLTGVSGRATVLSAAVSTPSGHST